VGCDIIVEKIVYFNNIGGISIETRDEVGNIITADIYLNGSFIDSSPLILSCLAPGSYVIEARRSGYQSGFAAVDVIAGQTTLAPIVLRSGAVSVTIKSFDIYTDEEISDVSVYIEGYFVGVTPLTIDLVPGWHRAKFEKANYKTEELSISVGTAPMQEKEIRLLPTVPPPTYTLKIYPVVDTAGNILSDVTVYYWGFLTRTKTLLGTAPTDPATPLEKELVRDFYTIFFEKEGYETVTVDVPLNRDTEIKDVVLSELL